MVARDDGLLQIPYKDYMALMEKVTEGQQLRQIRDKVVSNLKTMLQTDSCVEAITAKVDQAMASAPAPKKPAAPAPKAQAAPAPEPAAPAPKAKVTPAPEPPPVAKKAPQQPAQAAAPAKANEVDTPPIKKDISAHFNKLDESGRLFSVFKQYYTCLNDTCGGTVRVTMKDGFCSLWNYDEWEEFAFIDIFEGHLRIALDPRYTDALQSLSFCEVPRLLSSRRSLVCVQVDDLSKTMLEVLVKAFQEVGLTAS